MDGERIISKCELGAGLYQVPWRDGDPLSQLNGDYDNPTPDWSQHVEPLIKRLVDLMAGHDGEFVISTVGSEDLETGTKLAPKILHVPNGDNANTGLFDAIRSIATERRGNNCYIGIALMKSGLSIKQKGSEADVVGGVVDVVDFDGKHDPQTRRDRLPRGYPHAEVETSPGNYQCWYFFDRPLIRSPKQSRC